MEDHFTPGCEAQYDTPPKLAAGSYFNSDDRTFSTHVGGQQASLGGAEQGGLGEKGEWVSNGRTNGRTGRVEGISQCHKEYRKLHFTIQQGYPYVCIHLIACLSIDDYHVRGNVVHS